MNVSKLDDEKLFLNIKIRMLSAFLLLLSYRPVKIYKIFFLVLRNVQGVHKVVAKKFRSVCVIFCDRYVVFISFLQ